MNDETVINDDVKSPTSKKLETCEDWQGLFTMLANPKCTKCYGRGYVGLHTVGTEVIDGETVEKKMPVGCSAKRCALSNFRLLVREQKMRQMKEKQVSEEKVANEQ